MKIVNLCDFQWVQTKFWKVDDKNNDQFHNNSIYLKKQVEALQEFSRKQKIKPGQMSSQRCFDTKEFIILLILALSHQT